MLLYVPVPPGEALDRLSILEIKQERAPSDLTKMMLGRFRAIVCTTFQCPYSQLPEYVKLLEVNKTLWDLESQVRDPKVHGRIDMYLSVAQAIFENNQLRASVKKRIDDKFGLAGEAKHYGETNLERKSQQAHSDVPVETDAG